MSPSAQAPRGVLPHPALSVLLALAWLALQQSLALPQLITAAVLGWGLPQLLHGFLGRASGVKRWAPVPRFALLVLWDIVVSNFTVARIVLSPGARPQPAWVPVPLDITHPSAVMLLATVITTTPGTVSCVVDEPGAAPEHPGAIGGGAGATAAHGPRILVHALDCSDPATMAADIKARYERPLKEIFE